MPDDNLTVHLRSNFLFSDDLRIGKKIRSLLNLTRTLVFILSQWPKLLRHTVWTKVCRNPLVWNLTVQLLSSWEATSNFLSPVLRMMTWGLVKKSEVRWTCGAYCEELFVPSQWPKLLCHTVWTNVCRNPPVWNLTIKLLSIWEVTSNSLFWEWWLEDWWRDHKFVELVMHSVLSQRHNSHSLTVKLLLIREVIFSSLSWEWWLKDWWRDQKFVELMVHIVRNFSYLHSDLNFCVIPYGQRSVVTHRYEPSVALSRPAQLVLQTKAPLFTGQR